jgi:hypothetical protein
LHTSTQIPGSSFTFVVLFVSEGEPRLGDITR